MLGYVVSTLQTLIYLIPTTQCQVRWASLAYYREEVTEPQKDLKLAQVMWVL